MMHESKRKQLEAKGWKIGGVEEFLQLSPEEAAYIELRLKLSDGLQEQRRQHNLTQVELAQRRRS